MNLKLLTIALCFFSIHLTYAQNEEVAKPTTTQLGVNATQFINTFLSFNENNAPTGAYLFSLKFLQDNKGFRLGTGFGFSKTTAEVDANQEDRTNKNNFFNLRAGYEWQIPITKRWLTYFGLDAIFGISKFESEFDPGFGRIITKNENLSFGGGGIMGIQFNINNRISLATESTLYFIHRNLESEQIFPDQGIGGEDKQTSKTTSDQFSPSLPTSLFIQINF